MFLWQEPADIFFKELLKLRVNINLFSSNWALVLNSLHVEYFKQCKKKKPSKYSNPSVLSQPLVEFISLNYSNFPHH